MRTKISKLAKGIFDKTTPELTFSVETIRILLPTEGVLFGNFSIDSQNGIDARGLIYSDSSYLALKDTSFIGKHADIHYEANAQGIKPGKKVNGMLQIVSDAGELSLPYEITVEEQYMESSMGKIKNLFHFTNLVKNHYEEALSLFFSSSFAAILLPALPKERNLYETLCKGSSPKTAMEEFLVCVSKKSRIVLSLEKEREEYLDFKQTIGDTLIVKKDTWGYTEIDAIAEGDFIRVDRPRFTTEEFLGNRFELSYQIEENRVHAGYNLGKIRIETPYQSLEYQILVYRYIEKKEDSLEWKKGICHLSHLYFAFRLHEITTDIWCRNSMETISRMRRLRPEDIFIRLFEIQVLITMKKAKEVAGRLSNLAEQIFSFKEEEPFLYSYCLYVQTLLNRDSTFAKEAAAQVKELYEQNQKDARLLWVILYLDEECALNKSLRLTRIKEQALTGSNSSFLYYEACIAMNEQPVLIRVLNQFELRTARWGISHGILNEKAAQQLSEQALLEQSRQPLLIQTLKAIYRKYENRTALEALLSQLIRYYQPNQNNFIWFQEGVQRQITMTGLYEAYMNSLPYFFEGEIPKAVLLYFIYDQALDERRKELLYSNIILHTEENSTILKNYLPAIEQFAEEQLRKGRVSKKLACIYQKILTSSILNEEIAAKLPAILLTKRLKCLNPKVCNVVVKHKELDYEWRLPLINQEAYFPVYTLDCAIIFEDAQGRRFLEHTEYEIEDLLEEKRWLRECQQLSEGDIWFWLFAYEKGGSYKRDEKKKMALLSKTVACPFLKEAYRSEITQNMMDYYLEHNEGEELENYLQSIDKERMDFKEHIKVTELLIIRGMYEDAWEMVNLHGFFGISPNQLLRLCIRQLSRSSMEEEETLLKACIYVYQKGKYEETVLQYLILYYNHTSKEMCHLWQAATNFEVDTADLEERILMQALFTGSFVPNMMEIFSSYYKNGRSQTVKDAYLACQSYLYFVKDTLIDERIFQYLKREYQLNGTMLPICQMALLSWLTKKDTLAETEQKMAEQMLEYLTVNRKYFSFYQKLSEQIPLPFALRDKTILEYRTEPGNKVSLHYNLDKEEKEHLDYRTEQMEHIYEGIYGKQMILFYGDKLQYYITEEAEGKSKVTQSDAVKISHWSNVHGESRYDMLNDMAVSIEMQDEQTLVQMMENYLKRQELVERNSTLM